MEYVRYCKLVSLESKSTAVGPALAINYCFWVNTWPVLLAEVPRSMDKLKPSPLICGRWPLTEKLCGLSQALSIFRSKLQYVRGCGEYTLNCPSVMWYCTICLCISICSQRWGTY